MLSASHAPNLKVDNTVRTQLWVKFLGIRLRSGASQARRVQSMITVHAESPVPASEEAHIWTVASPGPEARSEAQSCGDGVSPSGVRGR
jgi:hypothetical protein